MASTGRFFARLSPGVLLLGAVRILLSAVIGFPEEGEGCMAAPGKTPGRNRGFGPRSCRKRRATSSSDERVVIAEVVAEDCFEFPSAETSGTVASAGTRYDAELHAWLYVFRSLSIAFVNA